jgi:predicted MFS family arabinose efflux permease
MFNRIINSFPILGKLSKNEKLIIISQSISTVGDLMALPAFLNLALLRGKEVVSLFIIFNFLPRIAQPFLGTIVDRVNPKKLILFADFFRIVIFIALFLYPKDYPTIFWLLLPFFSSVFACIFEPSRLKIMSQFGTNFAETNSAFYFFYSVTGIISVVISLLVEKYTDTNLVFLINALTFVASFLILVNVKYNYNKSVVKQKISLFGFFKVISYFKKYNNLLICTTFIVLIDFFTGVLYELFPEKSIAIGFEGYGTYIFSFVISVGNTIGSLLIPIIYKKLRLLPILSFIICILLNIFFLTNNYLISFVSCLGFFILQMIAIGISEVAIQEKIPHKVQGQLFAINESLPVTALSLGSVLSGLTNTYILCLATVLVFTAYIAIGSQFMTQYERE